MIPREKMFFDNSFDVEQVIEEIKKEIAQEE